MHLHVIIFDKMLQRLELWMVYVGCFLNKKLNVVWSWVENQSIYWYKSANKRYYQPHPPPSGMYDVPTRGSTPSNPPSPKPLLTLPHLLPSPNLHFSCRFYLAEITNFFLSFFWLYSFLFPFPSSLGNILESHSCGNTLVYMYIKV